MRNRVTLDSNIHHSICIRDIEVGSMFQNINCQDESNVYMKTGWTTALGNCRCVLLTTGNTYDYEGDKPVMPIRRGRSLTITQGG